MPRPMPMRLVQRATLCAMTCTASQAPLAAKRPEGRWLRAMPVRDAIATSITTLPEQLRRSLTWDQGELAQRAQLRIDADLDIYFCDSCQPPERTDEGCWGWRPEIAGKVETA